MPYYLHLLEDNLIEMLNEKEIHRYSRHILLDKVGLQGQEKLKSAKVLVVGAGGLGCPVLQYLTAAGVGTIGIIDFDSVDETNLQRQILFTTQDIGKNKALAAQEHLALLNPFITIQTFPERLTNQNALELFQKFDVIVDGTDNFSTRYLVNDACVITEKPLVYGSIYKFEGQVTVFNYKNGPSYRCLFPEPPKVGSVPNCSQIGVIGVLPGLIGTQQANETIKIILEIGTVLSGKLLIYDALSGSSTSINIMRSEEQISKTKAMKANFASFNYDIFCGIETISSVDIEEFKNLLQSENIQVVDVRDEWEQPRVNELNALIAPLDDLDNFVNKIDRNKKVVVVCQRGARSMQAILHLKKEYGFINLINLDGGLLNWK